MSNFKKVFSVVLALLMVLSLAACNASDKAKDSSEEAKVTRRGKALSQGIIIENDKKDNSKWEDIDNLSTVGLNDVSTKKIEVDKNKLKVAGPEYGKAASGSDRSVTVDNNNVVFKGFMGICTNVFPHALASFVQKKVKDNSGDYAPAYEEIMTKRWNAEQFAYARSWFQIDYMVTDEMGNGYKDTTANWDQNKDYQNYKNGIYDMESDLMKACWDYWTELETAGTEIYLAYGWKVGTRVQAWFSAEPDTNRSKMGAPRDLKLYANACAALYKYARKTKGLTNFNTLAFYNEVDRADDWTYDTSWDYVAIGDKVSFFARMLVECANALKADPDTKDVEVFAADCQNNILYSDGSMTNQANGKTYNCIHEDLTGGMHYINPYLRKYYHNYMAGYTFHYYYFNLDPIYNYEKGPNQYNKGYHWLYTDLSQAYQWYDGENKKLMLTEINFSDPSAPASMSTTSTDQEILRNCYGYEGTVGPGLVGIANTGFKAGFVWVSGSPVSLPDPDGAWSYNEKTTNGSDTPTWPFPRSEKNLKTVYSIYYEYALINNYIKHNSNVHKVDWTGSDMRCAAFSTSDGKGDFTLFVASNAKGSQKLTCTLTKALNKPINVFGYDTSIATTEQGTIPPRKASISNVGTTFNYTMNNTGYNLWIFTTCEPVKQLEIANGIMTKASTSSEVPLKVTGVDCNLASEDVIWTITRYSTKTLDSLNRRIMRTDKDKVGTISQAANSDDATYKFPSDAKTGDTVAIRAYLKSNPRCFASKVITAK